MTEPGQINETTQRWRIIQDVISNNDIKTIVEIGTWNGNGSTLAILKSKRHDAQFVSIESNFNLHQTAKKNLELFSENFQLLYGRVVEISEVKKYLESVEIDNTQKTWLESDLNDFNECENVINYIPENIDFLLLDGGEFSTYCEWIKLKHKTKIVALDDIYVLKCNRIYNELSQDKSYELVHKTEEGHGFCVFKKKMVDIIEINKFSKLHDGNKIIFCKTDYLLEEFDFIRTLEHDVVLVSGNSDYCIDDSFLSKMPNNIKKWFAQNALIKNDVIECLPLGIENRVESYRPGHGVGYYERVEEKENLILNHDEIKPSGFIYANFNLNTNYNHRSIIKQICLESDFIDWEEPNLSITDFFLKILKYEAVVCAQGNDNGDNHRIYETLYMGRIPITFNKVMYDNLHHLFPVVLIQNYKELTNYDIMKSKINDAKNKKWDKSLLEMSYWINNIINVNNKI